MMNPNPTQFGGSFQQPPQQRKGCWGRHWKWIVPTGCLGLILAVVLLVGGIFFAAMSAMRSSEVYQGALERARANPSAVALLGEPIEDGWLVKGSFSVTNGRGSADFNLPVSGPKKSGRLYVRAVSEGGPWTYERLDLSVDDASPVSLLDSAVERSQPGSDANVEADSGEASGNSEERESASDNTAEAEPESGGPAVEAGVLDDKAVSKPSPSYPAIAKAARAEGTVRVQVVVDETGSVVSASAISGHPLLQAAATAAARQAKFAPTLVEGKPERIRGVLTYNFVLE